MNEHLISFWYRYFCDPDFADSVRSTVPNWDDVNEQTYIALVKGIAEPIPEYTEAYNRYVEESLG